MKSCKTCVYFVPISPSIHPHHFTKEGYCGYSAHDIFGDIVSEDYLCEKYIDKRKFLTF